MGSRRASRDGLPIPALLNSRSTRPCRATDLVEERPHHGLRVTSVGTGRAERSGYAAASSRQGLAPPADDHHPPAIAGQGERRRRTDSTAGPGHDSNPISHPRPPSRLVSGGVAIATTTLSTRGEASDGIGPVQIGVVGTGVVARSLVQAWAAGHQVTLGTRDPEQTRAREEWADVDLPLVAYADLEGEVFVNSTTGRRLARGPAGGRASAGRQGGDRHLEPARLLQGFPPSLFVSNTDSLVEQLQRELPEARLVKLFNTMSNPVMIDPARAGRDSTIFVAGNDEDGPSDGDGAAARSGLDRHLRSRRPDRGPRSGDVDAALAADLRPARSARCSTSRSSAESAVSSAGPVASSSGFGLRMKIAQTSAPMLITAATPKARLRPPFRAIASVRPASISVAVRDDMIATSRATPAAPATCCEVARMALPCEYSGGGSGLSAVVKPG